MRAFNRRGDGAVEHSGQPNGRLVGGSTDDRRHRVGRVARFNRWRTADGARAAVDVQAVW